MSRGTKRLPLGGDTGRDPAGGTGEDQVVIEGEVIDDENTGTGTGHETYFSWAPPFGERSDTSETVDVEPVEQARDMDTGAPKDKREVVINLREQAKAARERYVKSLSRLGLTETGDDEVTADGTVSPLHRVYGQMMAQTWLSAFQQGLSTQSAVKALGMGSAMLFMSPAFRDQVRRYPGQIKTAVDDHVRARAQKVLENAGSSPDQRDKAHRWLEQVRYHERGNRLPFSYESAALTELGLLEDSYGRMRRGADPVREKERYDKVIDWLHAKTREDGLDANELNRSVRRLIADQVSRDPEVVAMVTGTAHGGMRPMTRQVHHGDQVHEVVTGDFGTCDGRSVGNVRFTPRVPMGADEHRARLARTMHGAMSQTLDVKDKAGFAASVWGSGVAYTALHERVDTSQLQNGPMREWVLVARAARQAMHDDGINEDEARGIWANAHIDAMEQMGAQRPDFESGLQACFGQNWQEVLGRSSMDVSEFLRTRAPGWSGWNEPEQTAQMQQPQASAWEKQPV